MKNLKKSLILSTIIISSLTGVTSFTSIVSAETPTIVAIHPFQNMVLEGGSTLNINNLTFVQNSGPGILYYDSAAKKYVWIQTQSASSYTIQTIINGWVGNLGSNNFQAYTI